MVIISIPGVFLLWLSSQAIHPISYKFKESSFVPVQATINSVTIYESKSSEKKRSSSYNGTRSGVDAYFVRLDATFSYNDRTYTVDAKKYGGQYETFAEAYAVTRSVAPEMPVTVSYYYKKKISMPDQIDFLKTFKQLNHKNSAPMSIKINPKNPMETTLDDPYVANKVVQLLLTFVFFFVPIAFSWFCIRHFGKAPALANGIVLIVLVVDCMLAFVINKTSPNVDHTSGAPKFSFVMDTSFNYDHIKQFITEE